MRFGINCYLGYRYESQCIQVKNLHIKAIFLMRILAALIFFRVCVCPNFCSLELDFISNFSCKYEKESFQRNADFSSYSKAREGYFCKGHCSGNDGVSERTFYKWRDKSGGMQASDIKKLRDMESELSAYKKLVEELAFMNRAMKALIE
jgi:putative transposase